MGLIIMPKMPIAVLVTGSTGQLGRSIQYIQHQYPLLKFTFVSSRELDLCDQSAVTSYFDKNEFETIINCAAYTAVDKAESDTLLADKINHLAVKQLAEIAKHKNSVFIHVSTDYVFNGKNYKPYLETDTPSPQGVYGESKLNGELAFQAVGVLGCIIRTSWVYSEYGNNFVKTMQRLGSQKDSLNVIYDQVGSPTYAGDLANAILVIVQSKSLRTSALVPQVYHYSNEGVCSWYDFAKTIFELSDIDCSVNPIETKDYPTTAERPNYSLLNKTKIKNYFELEIPYWKDSLQKCIKRLQEQD
jgi:dTDP-4-dehydrorhamnose reductase